MKKIMFAALMAIAFLTAAARPISYIEQTPSWIYLYDENGKKFQSLSSSIGLVVGYSSEIFVVVSHNWVYVYNSEGKKITSLSASSVGEVLGVTGNTFTSRNGNWIYTWDKSGKKINTRSAR